LEINQK
jgi:Flp pilus assembly protein TadD